jgi:hypothetical protein
MQMIIILQGQEPRGHNGIFSEIETSAARPLTTEKAVRVIADGGALEGKS